MIHLRCAHPAARRIFCPDDGQETIALRPKPFQITLTLHGDMSDETGPFLCAGAISRL